MQGMWEVDSPLVAQGGTPRGFGGATKCKVS